MRNNGGDRAISTSIKNFERLKDSFLESIGDLANAMPIMKKEKSKKLLSLADQLTDFEDGVRFLYESMAELTEAGIFSDSMWQDTDKLVPSLVGGTLKAGGQSTVMEILSELRILSIREKKLSSEKMSAKEASLFLKKMLVSNLDLIFPDGSEELRNIPEQVTRKIDHLFSFLKEYIPVSDLKADLAEEIHQICVQRPIITDRALHILETIRNEVKLDKNEKSDRLLLKYINAAFSPTPACIDHTPETYADFLKDCPADKLTDEAAMLGKTMRDTGLSSFYHVTMLRFVAENHSLLGKALGLDQSGRAELSKHKEFVTFLVQKAITPKTARSCYGLARFIERTLLSHQPVKSGLERLFKIEIHEEVAENLKQSHSGSNQSPLAILLADCLGILGQPLGIGQGWNPTCQSARGISLWSRHAPGKLLRMIETAAKTNNLTMRFEGQLLSSSELGQGVAEKIDYNLDAVSVALVPHLDRIYNEMMKRASYRNEDPHKWVNPALYGHWIPVGFSSAYDYLTNSIRDYENFLRTLYVTHHPAYNGGNNLVYPNPVGIFLTGSTGKLLGFHAVSLLRVAEHEGEVRIYFLNPNNEGRQQWQSDIKPSIAGKGERSGESSLPFYQFASRVYAFHFNPSDLGALNQVDDEIIQKVIQIAKNSWGTSYTWTESNNLQSINFS